MLPNSPPSGLPLGCVVYGGCFLSLNLLPLFLPIDFLTIKEK